MKVNGIKVPELFSYTNIVVEKTEQGLTYPKSVPCCIDYDVSRFVGSARITTSNGVLCADIDLLEDCKGFYPGICFDSINRHVFFLGINKNTNIDPEIKPL